MNTVNELEQKLDSIRNIGYRVCYDWFGGTGGGWCQIGNQKYLFLDLAVGAIDHLAVVNDVFDREGISHEASCVTAAQGRAA